MEKTADILKSLRGAGLSQLEISRRSGIPQPRLSRWISDDPPVAADDALTLQRLAADLGLLGAVAPINAASPQNPQIPSPRKRGGRARRTGEQTAA